MTALLTLVPWWGRLFALLAFAVSLVGYGYVKGLHHGEALEAQHDATRTKSELNAYVKRVADNKALAAKQDADKVELKKGYANEIAKSTAGSATAPKLRVPSPKCDKPTGTNESQSAGRGDGGDPETRVVSDASERVFKDLELKVEKIFAGCRVAQEFIKSEGMAP